MNKWVIGQLLMLLLANVVCRQLPTSFAIEKVAAKKRLQNDEPVSHNSTRFHSDFTKADVKVPVFSRISVPKGIQQLHQRWQSSLDKRSAGSNSTEHHQKLSISPPVAALSKTRPKLVPLRKLEPRDYNPLPYGGGETKSETEDEEANPAAQRYNKYGLPFARRPSRKEARRQPLRLPIPDSETGYRKPVDEQVLKNYRRFSYLPKLKTPEQHNTEETLEKIKDADVESFRVLLEVVKSLIVPVPFTISLSNLTQT